MDTRACGMRVCVCLSLAIVALGAARCAWAQGRTLELSTAGEPRTLHGPIFGASTTHFFERLLGVQEKVAVLATMGIGLARFPGGSDANFYDWRSGLPEIEAGPRSSPYVRFWARAAQNIARGKPQGIRLEQFGPFARQIGAQVILVPNLETSSIAQQVSWFKRLAREGLVPTRIELGNEFWIAMGNDPASIARWPDEPTSMRIMKQYLDALKPFLPAGTKVAVQAAAGAVDSSMHPRARFWQRLRQWDEDLVPEPWFDAVTLHLYPRLREVMGDPEAGSTPVTPSNALPRLHAMMARVDEGIENILKTTERRLPGKEIWVTEWNPHGADPAAQRKDRGEPVSGAIMALLTARVALVFLRHPALTAALFFQMEFMPRIGGAMFVPDGRGSYQAVPAAAALRWLDEAANGGGSFQRVVQTGARPVAGGGARPESYLPIEGGVFSSGPRTTLILENASGDSLSFDPQKLVPRRRPKSVEVLDLPDLADPRLLPARIRTVDASGRIAISPFSLTRVTWE